MAFDIPLPKAVADVEAGGPFVTAAKGLNSLKKAQLENKYKPLEIAIKAQNALSYNNRMGNIGLFLKSISEMPVGERQIYLSDPVNRKNYMDMTEQFRSGINNPGSSSNFLSPEYIRSFGIGQQGQQGNQGSSSLAGNILGGITNTLGNIFNPLSKNNNQQPINTPPVNQNMGNAPSANNNTPSSDNNYDNGYSYDANGNNVIGSPDDAINRPSEQDNKIAPSADLTPQDRDKYAAQKRANNVGLGRTIINRADNSIAFESYLQQQRPELSKAFADAFKYNQLYGKAQNWIDKFKKEQPEKYQNYIFAKNTARELIGNGVRFLENMGQSQEAQHIANDLVGALDKWDVSPETAMNVFNKTIRSLYGVSDGVLKSAENIYPGVRRKLAGVSEFKGNYITPEQMNENKKVNSDNSKVPSDWIIMRKPSGKLTAVHPDDVTEAEKNGYSKNATKNVKGYS